MKRLMVMCAAAFLAMFAIGSAANAQSIINGKTCYLVPNTSQYVEYPGQTDCYTGEHVSVEGNSGNNIGTSPQARKAPLTHKQKRSRRHDRAWDRFKNNKHNAVHSGILAYKALRNRDWAAYRSHKADARGFLQVAAKAYKTWQRTAPK